MSGANIKGPQQLAVVKQKHRPNYSNDVATGRRKMEKESSVEIDVRAPQTSRIKIGIRVKSYQQIETLQIKGRGTVLKLWKETDPFPSGEGPLSSGQPSITTQLEAVFPTVNPDGTATGDQWVGFIAKYDPTVHGTKSFDTDLVVNPVDRIPANGFQPVTIAFTPEGNLFQTDHYLVATSVLPGENSTFSHTAITLGGSKAKTVKKPAKAKKPASRKSKTSKKKKKR